MRIENFEHRPGVHCGSVAMADLLRWAGVELSEAMVFGLGSGLGFYYLKSEHMSPSRQIGGRVPNLEENCAEVLGLELVAHRTDEADRAWEDVRDRLEEGVPVLIQCDLSELPYWETETPFNGHRVVLAGWDSEDDSVLVADTHFEELQRIDRGDLRRARASSAPPTFGNRFAWWELVPGEARSLDEAIPEALGRNVEAFDVEEGALAGLAGLRTFRDEVVDWRELDDAVWGYRFAYQIIEKRGTGGGMFRALYRDYLAEAADHVPELLRHQLATSMSRNADAWSTLATYLRAMSMFLDSEGDELDEDPTHHVESMAEAVYQFESTFWNRVDEVFSRGSSTAL